MVQCIRWLSFLTTRTGFLYTVKWDDVRKMTPSVYRSVPRFHQTIRSAAELEFFASKTGRGVVFLRSRSKTDGGITLKNLSDGGGEEGKWWEPRSNKSEGTDVDSMESAPVLYQSLFHCWCVFPLTTGTWWLKTCQLINTTGCFALPSHSTQIWVCRSKSYGTFFCGSGANE